MKKILLIIVLIFIAIQFIKPQKNIHAGSQPNDISSLYPIPADVDSIMVKACKDCHSNNTRYPWYNNFQPVAWFLDNHVRDGKRSFNLNEFATYSAARKYDKAKEIKNQIDKSQMPISSYTFIHKDAILTDIEKKIVITWSEGIRTDLEKKYPKDSLEEKHDHNGPPDN